MIELLPDSWFNRTVKALTQSRNSKLFIALILLIFGCSLLLRLYHLSQPSDKIFDEVYFPVFANNYLTKTDFYDAHPPLGKLVIATSIFLFGNVPLGWRFMNALAGTALLVVVLGFTYELTKRWQTAIIAMFLVAIDPMALVESRVGVINIYLALFSILGLWLFWRWYTTRKVGIYIVSLIAFGAAAAVKWIGLGTTAAAFIFWGSDLFLTRDYKNKKKVGTFLIGILLALVIIPAVYTLTFIPDLLRHQDFIWWHKSTWNYHAHLNATHPYGSAWWTWAIMLRPIWLYYKAVSPGVIQGIIEPGNLVTWVGGLLGLVVMLAETSVMKNHAKRQRNTYLIFCYLLLYLPWIFIGRVKFIYHYFVPVLILLIILAIVLDEHVFSTRKMQWLGVIFLIAGYAFFIYFLPLLMGIPVSQAFYQHHMWLKSWI